MHTQQLLTAANTLNLESEAGLLKALGEADGHLAQLKGHIDGLADLEDLLNRINSAAQAVAVKQVFQQLQFDGLYAKLTGFLGKIAKADEKIPHNVKGLLNSLSYLRAHPEAAHVNWSIATPSKPAIKIGRYTLDLGASAGVTFDANARWSDEATPRLLISVHGALKASANAVIPYRYGPIKAGGDASAKPTLDYYFNPAGDPLFAVAVADRISALPDPFDFNSVWKAFRDERLALEGMAYEFVGGAHANLEVVVANPLPLAGGVVGDIGVTVSVGAGLNSTYRLRLRRTASGFSATLLRDKVATETFGYELKLDADLGQVTAPVLKALGDLSAQWDEALDRIKPFLTPGTLLRDNLVAQLSDRVATLIHNDDLQTAIVADAKSALGIVAPSEAALAGWLEDRIVSAIDQGSALIDGNVDGAVEKTMAKLGAALPATLATDASQQLKSLVKDQVAALNAKLVEAVGEVLKLPVDQVKSALTQAGVTVSGAITTVDALLKPVRDLLTQYDKAFRDMVSQVETALKQKAGLRLFAAETDEQEVVVEIDGEFTARTDEAEGGFNTLVRGSLSALVGLVAKGVTVPGFAIQPATSSIARFSSFGSKQGVEVVFFGVTLLRYDEIAKGNVKVRVTGLGDVQVDTEAELSKTLSIFNTRGVSFVDSSALVLARAMWPDPAAPKPRLTAGLGASFSDKRLDWSDIAPFVRSLVDAGLAQDTALTSGEVIFNGWTAQGAGGRVKAAVSVTVELSQAQAEKLMQLDQRDQDHRLTYAARRMIVVTAIDRLTRLSAIKPKAFTDGAAAALEVWARKPGPTPVADVVLQYRTGISSLNLPDEVRSGSLPSQGGMPHGAPPIFTSGSHEQETYPVFLREAVALEALVELIDQMGQVFLAKPGVQAAAGFWTVADYKAAQRAMVADSRLWLTVFTDVVGLFSSAITPRTLAFMRTVVDLAGAGDAAPKVALKLTCYPAGGDPLAANFA